MVSVIGIVTPACPSAQALCRGSINFSMLGELTDQGRTTTRALGDRIRRLYVDNLGFLPPTLEDENILYLRFFNPLNQIC